MPGEVHRDHGVLGLQGFDLRGPVVGIACPAMDENDGGLAGSPDAIVDVDTVWSQGELGQAIDVRGRLGLIDG